MNAKGSNPIIGIYQYSEYEDMEKSWNVNGRVGNYESCLDLFFADDKERLSEFEQAMTDFAYEMFDKILDIKKDVNLKEWKDKLLDLARKELEEKYRIHLIDKDDSDWEDGYKKGKQDALKDLPKWKRDCFHNINSAVDGRLYYNGYYIDINELKLPKEE